MKRFLFLFTLLLALSNYCLSQKSFSGKSKGFKFSISPDYKRGLPPNLFLNMSFQDDNNNGVLEAMESAKLKLVIKNNGKGPAQGLLVQVRDSVSNSAILIEDGIKVPYIHSGHETTINIPITAKKEIESGLHKLKINVREHFGYDMDPAYLVLNTYALQKPVLVLSGIDIVDKGEGLMAISEDGQLQLGEMVKVKVVVQNIGQNVAKNTTFKVSTEDKNIYLAENQGSLGNIEIGEVKEFWITVSPNKRVREIGRLPVLLSLENDFNLGEPADFPLPIEMNQKPPETNIIAVKPNVESLTKQVARFEYSSKKITSNIGNIIDIKQVAPSRTSRPNSVAIVIGVEKYNHFAPAPYAANDAKIIERYFKDVLGVSQVISFTNEQVSGFFFENIFNPAFGELQKAIIKGETELFVFYSGHGLPSKKGDKIYLFPSDGRIEALQLQGYDINKFYLQLNQLGAKRTTLFIDACFSGVSRTSENYESKNLVAMKGVRIVPDISRPWENNPSFSVFSSSGFSETSLGFDSSNTGLFTYYVCAGLQGNADVNGDKKITTGELAAYVSENVRQTSKKILGLQSPQFYGNKNHILAEY